MNSSSNAFIVKVLATSPIGTTALAPGGTLLAKEGTWSFGALVGGGNATLLNGTQMAGGGGVKYKAATAGTCVMNDRGNWYLWAAPSWTPLGPVEPT